MAPRPTLIRWWCESLTLRGRVRPPFLNPCFVSTPAGASRPLTAAMTRSCLRPRSPPWQHSSVPSPRAARSTCFQGRSTTLDFCDFSDSSRTRVKSFERRCEVEGEASRRMKAITPRGLVGASEDLSWQDSWSATCPCRGSRRGLGYAGAQRTTLSSRKAGAGYKYVTVIIVFHTDPPEKRPSEADIYGRRPLQAGVQGRNRSGRDVPPHADVAGP